MSDKFDSLQEEKPHRDCYEWENGMLTQSITASIEKKNALDPKFGNKKFDQAVPFVCFSTETRLDTMKEVKWEVKTENREKLSSIAQIETTMAAKKLFLWLTICLIFLYNFRSETKTFWDNQLTG